MPAEVLKAARAEWKKRPKAAGEHEPAAVGRPPPAGLARAGRPAPQDLASKRLWPHRLPWRARRGRRLKPFLGGWPTFLDDGSWKAGRLC